MTSYDMSITPSEEGECLFEAYHSIFSWLTSTKHIYTQLAELSGSNFVYSDEESILTETINNNSNCIFCEDNESTHYMFYRHPTREIYNPYMYFQLYNTHGNCFAYALYLSSLYNGESPNNNNNDNSDNNDNNDNNNILINISGLLEKKQFRGNKYMKVKNDYKQLAYKCFVYNDFKIINWIIDFVYKNQRILSAYKKEWNRISREDKEYYGIPLNKNYTFDLYFKQLSDLAGKMSETYKMTLDQITNWDKEKNNLPPYQNSGIENSDEINKDDYDITKNHIELNELPKLGGKYKNKKQRKSNKIK
jgi:hypothetical protein